VCGREKPSMNLGVALAECRSGRAPRGSDGSMTVGYENVCKKSWHTGRQTRGKVSAQIQTQEVKAMLPAITKRWNISW